MSEKAGAVVYLVPSHTLQGSPAEMLSEIDEAVRALLALRQLIAVRASAVQTGSGSSANR